MDQGSRRDLGCLSETLNTYRNRQHEETTIGFPDLTLSRTYMSLVYLLFVVPSLVIQKPCRKDVV